MVDGQLEFEIAMQSAEQRVYNLLHSTEWQHFNTKKVGRISRMRCSITENQMFKFEGFIKGRTVQECAALIHPEGPYRQKWDSQLSQAQIITEPMKNTLVIRHETKPRMMGLVSGRDTIDLCRFITDEVDGTRTVVMTGVTHHDAPRKVGLVRAHTHPSLMVITESGDDTRLIAILHGELHLIGMPSSITDQLIPKGIFNFFEDLKKFSDNRELKININQHLTGWLP